MSNKKKFPTPYRRYHKTAARRPLGGGFLLFFFSMILLVAIIKNLSSNQAIESIASTVGFLSLIGGAWCVRKGLYLQAQAQLRKYNRSTSVPWRVCGSILVGVATAIIALFVTDKSFIVSIGYGLGALSGTLLTYGLDPQYSDPDSVSKFGVTTDEVLEAIEEAQIKIINIDNAAKSIREYELKDRLRRITHKAGEILDIIEQDPRDLRRARKFLKVYLGGAEKVTANYVNMHPNVQDTKLENNFRNVLTTIEEVFEEQHKKLLENDVLDLDIQIEVLQAQLKHEGVI